MDQMVWFRDHWYEEVLRQLRQGLTKCYVIAFDNRTGVNDATITPHTLNFVKKLGATFGIGIENFSAAAAAQAAQAASSTSQSLAASAVAAAAAAAPASSSGAGAGGGGAAGSFSSAASESLVRRAQATAQDPVFQKMKAEFTQSFDFRSVTQFTSVWFFAFCLKAGKNSTIFFGVLVLHRIISFF